MELEEDRRRFLDAGAKANPFFAPRKACTPSAASSENVETATSHTSSVPDMEPVIFPLVSHIRQDCFAADSLYPSNVALKLKRFDSIPAQTVAPCDMSRSAEHLPVLSVADFAVFPNKSEPLEFAEVPSISPTQQLSESEIDVFLNASQISSCLQHLVDWFKGRCFEFDCNLAELTVALSRFRFICTYAYIFGFYHAVVSVFQDGVHS